MGAGLTYPSYAQNPEQDKPRSVQNKNMSDLLGWVNDPNNNNLCHGYYRANKVEFPSAVSQKDTVIQSTRATYYSDKPSILYNVHVLQPGREMTADQAYSVINANDFHSNQVNLLGNIHMNETGMLVIADAGQVNLKNNTSELNTVIYRFSRNYFPNSRLAITPRNIAESKDATYKVEDLTARGTASRVNQAEPNVVDLYDATYSTCPPDTHTWHVKASHINLDRNSGIGTAINMRLYVHDVPVFYFPYFNFPIDLKRKSGFLYPAFSTTSAGGAEFTIPYYWNIAPNYDATLTSNIYTERGVQLNSLFRYLTWDNLGTVYFSFLPEDREFKRFKSSAADSPQYTSQPGYQRLKNSSTDRTFISWQDQNIIDPNWTSLLYVNYASDDYYFQDFSKTPDTIYQNQLLQMANLNYDSLNWHVSGLVQNYETLHPVNNTTIIPDQYAHYPQIDFSNDYPVGDHFDYQTQGEFVNFSFPLMTNRYQANLPLVIGQRYDLRPAVSLPTYTSSFHFVPKVAFDATAYNLANQVPGEPAGINRGIPIFDIDTGLYYQRSTSLFDRQYNQTFEPRLFYLYVPDQNQDNLPLFDTSTQTFTYDSLFETNRFTGIDRIGDADQLGYGLTSRLINSQTGLDRLDASIGQIAYFEDRHVNINDSNDNLNPTNKLSPLVGQLRFQFLEHWYATANAAYQNSGNYFTSSSAGIQYAQDNQHVVSVSYNFLKNGDPLPNNYDPTSSRNNLNQVQVSEAWELTQRWGLYSSINYNISHRYAQNYLYGLSYSSCCWAVRFVAIRNFLGVDTNNRPSYDSGFAIQFALKGLSNVGNSSPNGVLEGGIPGYSDDFGREKIPAAQPYTA